MVNWKVTATTIYCDAVDDEITLMVYKDWAAKCVNCQKYRKADKELAKRIERKSKRLGRKLGCEGPECSRLIQYRDKLFAEETEKEGKVPTGKGNS